MKIHKKKKIEPITKLTQKQRILNHKERHPNDNNERDFNKGVHYGDIEEESTSEPTMDAIKKAMIIIESAKHSSLDIGDACPKCKGKIIWKGSSKYRATHCRCNMGCLI
jgi:hypothetical protein|tara:strand:- start:1557 stop:1883 length:327 start_codon:yes stop_codon:yes gene_type:complete